MQPAFLQDREFRQNSLKAALFALFAWLALGLFLEEFWPALLLGVLAGALLLGLLSYLPTARRKRQAQMVEAALPLALMNAAVELNLGLKFEKVIGHIAGQEGALGREFRKVLRETSMQGASVQEALLHFAGRIDSLEVKRAIALLVSVYEQGQRASGTAVKMLARELLAKQRAKAKEFSGKLVVYSLLFVAVSAVVPALFQSFVIVGSMVLQLTLTAQQIVLIIVVGFPALDLAALYYIKARTPLFMRS